MGSRTRGGFLTSITLIPQSGHHSQYQPSTPQLAAQPSTSLQVVRPVAVCSTGTCERRLRRWGTKRDRGGKQGGRLLAEKKSEGSCQAPLPFICSYLTTISDFSSAAHEQCTYMAELNDCFLLQIAVP
jgi:hypothetical protein